MKVGIVSMGCSKNLVDSERLARRFLDAGIEIDFDSTEGADYAVINTCGFIGDAKEESVNTILDLVLASAIAASLPTRYPSWTAFMANSTGMASLTNLPERTVPLPGHGSASFRPRRITHM